jgi:hypothetical protein
MCAAAICEGGSMKTQERAAVDELMSPPKFRGMYGIISVKQSFRTFAGTRNIKDVSPLITSLVPQSNHGINTHGPPGGNVASCKGNEQKDQSDTGKG